MLLILNIYIHITCMYTFVNLTSDMVEFLYACDFSVGQSTSFQHKGTAEGNLSKGKHIVKLILSDYIYYMRYW